MVGKKVLKDVHAELFGSKGARLFGGANKEKGDPAALGVVILHIDAVVEEALTTLQIN